ncbi:MAG: hypothetical protein HYW26_01010 [Candidatus Aenigmarchaeota archaeon]|nr:hypothetical protein [Candidatus Aenigmarchaeota archaeon]
MKNNAIVLLGLALFVSGCIGQSDITPVIKALPEVQQFLAQNPDADIRAFLVPSKTMNQTISSVEAECGQMDIKDYWKVLITKKNVNLTVWVDSETRNPVCIIKPGIVTNQTEIPPKVDLSSKIIRIDGASDNQIAVRNIGSVSIDSSDLAVFLDGKLQTCSWTSNSVESGSIIVCTMPSSCKGTVVKVTAPGNADTAYCFTLIELGRNQPIPAEPAPEPIPAEPPQPVPPPQPIQPSPPPSGNETNSSQPGVNETNNIKPGVNETNNQSLINETNNQPRNVTFSCQISGNLSAMVTGTQGGVVCSPSISNRNVSLSPGNHSVYIACSGAGRCSHVICIKGASFPYETSSNGRCTDGQLSPGDSTTAPFRIG